MLIAFSGLPGTGSATLERRVGTELEAMRSALARDVIASCASDKIWRRYSRGRMAVLLFALVVSAFPAIAQRNAPSEDEVFQALSASDRAVLYSLEPRAAPDAVGERLHHFLILGKTELGRSKTQEAAAAFKDAISTWKNGAENFAATCFDPRQGLRLTVNGHIYEFLLCYQCFKLEVFLDDKSVAWFGASGSPDTLNRILTDAAVPLSKTGK